MSRLDELIAELCPDGVEYRLLGEIAKAENERNKDRHCDTAYITQRGLSPTSEYFGDTKITSDDTSGYKIVKKGWFVYSPSRIDVGSINYLRDAEEVIVSPLNVVFRIDEAVINQGYLLHFLNSRSGTWQIITKREGIEGTGRKLLPFERFATIKVPVPPLPIQREIVRIMDSFTGLIEELTQELTARKKQYDYYRDYLLTFSKPNEKILTDRQTDRQTDRKINDTVKWLKIKDFCTISRGKVISKDYIRDHSGIYPVYSSQTENDGLLGSISDYMYEGEYLTWTTDGANAGTVFHRSGKFNITNVCGLLKPNDEIVDIRYLYYALSVAAKTHVNYGMGNPKLMSNVMSEIKVPIPSKERQGMIANILERFDTLCNNIVNGIPAEIAARQKQYKYYRDKLLTFKKLA